MRVESWLLPCVMLVLSGGLHAAVIGQLSARPRVDDVLMGGDHAMPSLGESFADIAAGTAARSVAAPAKDVLAPIGAAAATPAVPVLTDVSPVSGQDRAVVAPVSPVPGFAPAPPKAQVSPAHDAVPSHRPKPRPSHRPASDGKPPAEAKPKNAPQAAASGNADRDARKGSAQGASGTTAAPRAAKPTAKGDGGAAAAAGYGTAVLRKIAATRKAKAPGKGRAVVAFSIGANGALTSAKIITSSGSAALDAVALDHIRRAAPFPPPPATAQTRFSFEFVGQTR